MQNTEIIILAAGKGSRMQSELPKCLVPFKGIPMIERLISNIKKVPLLVVGHKAEQVKDYLKDKARYVHQHEQKGTGHATQIALEILLPYTKYVVVLYADHPFVSLDTVENLIQELTIHKVAMATTEAEDFEGWRKLFKHWGRIIYTSEEKIKGIIEYKDATEDIRTHRKINPGFYAFHADWLREALKEVKPNNVQGEYYLTDVIKMAESIGEVKISLSEAMGLNSKEEIEYAESAI